MIYIKVRGHDQGAAKKISKKVSAIGMFHFIDWLSGCTHSQEKKMKSICIITSHLLVECCNEI